MKKVFVLIIVIIGFFLGISHVSAGSGCCSHHGGQAYCNGGRWVCADGSVSPKCTCGSSESNNQTRTTTSTTTVKRVYGCTKSGSINYNSDANASDGSCKFENIETRSIPLDYEINVQGKLKSGNKKIIKKGKPGEKEITVKVITNEEGEEVSNEVISEKVIKEPLNEVVSYEAVQTRAETRENNGNGSFGKVIITTMVLMVINVYYAFRHREKDLIINQLTRIASPFKYALYVLYFVFVIPVFIDALLIILDLITKRNIKS